MRKVEDFTKEERKIYDRGRKDWWDISDEVQESIAHVYLKGYTIGYRDGKIGRKRIPHKTMDGWCCACDYDQVVFESKLTVQKNQELIARVKKKLKGGI